MRIICKPFCHGHVVVMVIDKVGVASCKVSSLKTLVDVHVKPEFRGRGYAGILVDYAIANLHVKRLCAKPYGVTPSLTEHELIEFYNRHGFIQSPGVPSRPTGTWKIRRPIV